ncbi:MAG: 5-(carboxyamino)imidazole ribonucleotide synthase [Bacillota bacterium]|nr:MAG: 5-(carboxyamino)imidazole ribonucleotide synthase [Bacillota bacterium]
MRAKDINGFPRLGIIGGGQLAKMMAQEAKKMGFFVSVLDPTPGCPASSVSDLQVVGDFYDEEKLEELVNQSDVTTYDLEHIATEPLKRLEEKGHAILPSPRLLEVIQDKLVQKEMLKKAGIPVPRFMKVEQNSLDEFKKFGFPLVQKARKGGYDGRGVAVIGSEKDMAKALLTESYAEELVDIEKELAVMVARSTEGQVKCYPVVEMIFDERANICDMVVAPARIEKELEQKAREIATEVVKALDGVGVFGIEMFLDRKGNILVNEVAPRPHNSGHYTIEACLTSQFEQHIRAICGLPLGSTKLLSPAAMVNLLGEEGYEGTPWVEGFEEVLSIEGLYFHFYGKKTTKPFRKMGHVTVIDDDVEKAVEKARRAKEILKVKAR